MTLQEFVGVLENSDRVHIINAADKSDIYIGYLAMFTNEAKGGGDGIIKEYAKRQVKRFRAVPEIRHKRWKELNLMKPLEPEETADFNFQDLQMSLYYTIYI